MYSLYNISVFSSALGLILFSSESTCYHYNIPVIYSVYYLKDTVRHINIFRKADISFTFYLEFLAVNHYSPWILFAVI